MRFDWSEYLNLANKLVGAKSTTPQADEACHRAAVSRAYYAAYCLTRNLARGRGWVTLTGAAIDHRNVKNHFKNSRQKNKKQIGVNLERLRADRNDADYKDVLRKPKAIASASISRANRILRLLSSP
jgi:hypothetical protein